MAWSTVGGGGGGGGTGDVTGPSSSANDNFVTFNGITGKIIKDSGLSLDTDVNLAADSDLKIPSQKAVKAYADAISGATPGGANTNVQFNNTGVFDGVNGFVFAIGDLELGLGEAGTATGKLRLIGNTSGELKVYPPDAITTYDLVLPADPGTSGQVLSTDGNGVTSWVSQPTATTPGGATTQVQYNNSGAFAGDAGFTWSSGTDTLTLGEASSATGKLALKGTTSGTVTLSVADAAGTWTFKLPNTAGTNGQVLTTDGSGNASWASTGSGTASPSTADGRLTLTSGTPVLSSDVTAATTLYYTPYIGNKIGLYNGSTWDVIDFAETSLSLSGYTADSNYDIWGYNNAGTLALESTIWTNDTTRATAITRQNGVWVKSGTPTRRLLGTIRTTATTGQTEMTFGGTAGGGVVGNLFVCNAQNKVRHRTKHIPTSSSWSYGTNSWREIQGGSLVRVNFIDCGLGDGWAWGEYCCQVLSSGSGSVSVGFNSTSPIDNASHGYSYGSLYLPLHGINHGKPIAGLNYLTGVENGNGGSTFYGNDSVVTGTGLRTEVFI